MLSVLILTVPERRNPPVIRHLCDQARDRPVEILWLGDNRRRTIGAKRQLLLNMAERTYVSFIDDDDDVAPDFVEQILAVAVNSDPNVITFDAEIMHSPPCIVRHGAGWENEEYAVGKTEIRRAAWHTHAWRRSLALTRRFPDTSWGEDWEWASALQNEGAKNSVHIDKVLHYYTYRG